MLYLFYIILWLLVVPKYICTMQYCAGGGAECPFYCGRVRDKHLKFEFTGNSNWPSDLTEQKGFGLGGDEDPRSRFKVICSERPSWAHDSLTMRRKKIWIELQTFFLITIQQNIFDDLIKTFQLLGTECLEKHWHSYHLHQRTSPRCCSWP